MSEQIVVPLPSGSNYRCGAHRAFAYARGGTTLIGELTPLTKINWRRIRDDISTAQATVGTTECCDLLGDLSTVSMELHVMRNDATVWQGPITRLEYQHDTVDIFADDMLWIAKRTAMSTGYNMAYPNIGDVIDRMHWLMRDQTFLKYGDPWKMVPHLHPIKQLTGKLPKSSRANFAYALTTWEDFDKYAEDMGTDYTVVNRDIYYWDINYAWNTLPDLTQDDISEHPRIVEYGSEFASRFIITNNIGYAGVSTADVNVIDEYGYIDMIDSTWNEATAAPPGTTNAPSAEELAEMQNNSSRQLSNRHPPPVAIVVPAGASLLPSSPWAIEDLIPGSWFNVRVTSGLCRKLSEVQRLHEVIVNEDVTNGEVFGITCVSAPTTRVNPT